MPAPIFSLGTLGLDPKYATKADLEAEINRVVGITFDQANPEDAVAAAASAALAAERADDTAAANGYRDFASLTTLVANSSLTYSAGTFQVVPGETLRTRKKGLSFEVADSAAVDNHYVTAGGVKFYETGYIFSTRQRAADAIDRGALVTTDSFIAKATGYVYTLGGGGVAFDDLGVSGVDQTADEVLTDPSGAVLNGSTIFITRADGGIDTYKAVTSFTWTDLTTHVFSATPDLILLNKQPRRYGAVPVPTGHTADADIAIYPAGDNRFVTSVDRREDYKALYQPANTKSYYVDNVNGSDANDGLTLATAFLTYSAARNAVIANTDGVIYLVNSGKCYDNEDGLTHVNPLSVDGSVIGIPNANGDLPFASNAWGPASFTFTQNGTYAWVYQSATIDDDIGQLSDVSVLETLVLDYNTGKTVKIPKKYTQKTSVLEVSKQAGSYWHDTTSNIIYVHMISGGIPTVSEDIVLPRSDVGIFVGAKNTSIYLEGISFISVVQTNAWGSLFINSCNNFYSYANGFYGEALSNFGTMGCTVVDPAADGFNYHNLGVNVTDITTANPAVVTSAGHGLTNGTLVTFADVQGMTEINGEVFTVANATTDTFEIGDTTGFSSYTTGGRVRLSVSRFHEIKGIAYFSGKSEGSNQSSTAHENCEGICVEPFYVGAYRDHITDIQESKRAVYGGYMGTTRIPASAGTDNRVVLGTDTCDIALMGVTWGGYYDPITLFSHTGAGDIRISDTELPYDTTKWANVTSTW